ALQERVYRLRRDEDHGGNLATSHLFDRQWMRDEHLLHVEPQSAENHGAGESCCGATGVEVDLLAPQIGKRVDLRPNENMQLGRKQIENVGDAPAHVGQLLLVFLKRVT